MIWHLLDPFIRWVYDTSISDWIRMSKWAVAVLEVFHLFGLVFLLGSVFMMGLRCFGLVMEQEPAGRVVRRLAPPLLGGWLLMTITGALIFFSGATRYVGSRTFSIKMTFYALAVIVQATIYLLALYKKDDDRRFSPLWIVMGGLAVLLWFGVGIAGRAIAFI